MGLRRLSHMVLPAALLLLAAPAGAADREVDSGNFFFKPDYVRIDPGDTVTWRMLDGSPHTVTSRRSAPRSFESGVKDPGETFAFEFTTPGRYPYFCRIHPSLGQNGVVQVGPDTTPPVVRGLRARRGRRAVRLSFRLSEDARVRATVARRGRTVKVIATRLLDGGRRSVLYRPRKLRPGRYRVTLRATDREANASKRVRVAFTVPRG